MKLRTRALVASAAAVSAAAALVVGVSGSASATAPPPYEPSLSTSHQGTLNLYDASGALVTHGSTTAAPFATYAVAATSDPLAGTTKATLFGKSPNTCPSDGTAPLFSGEALSASTTFPVVSPPGAVASAGARQPIATITSADTTLDTLSSDFPPSTTAGCAGIYTLWLQTSNGSVNSVWVADIFVDTVAKTWTQVFPVPTPAPAWRPLLSTTPRVGLVDTCLASFTGSPSVTYAWYVNGASIGVSTATYKVAEGYYGKSLACSVAASNAGGVIPTTTSAAGTVGIGPALIPTTRPYLYGNHVHGQYEYVKPGVWSPAATSYTYQWYVDSTRISGAIYYRYLVPLAYKGHHISCIVTAKRTYWTPGVYHTAAVLITA